MNDAFLSGFKCVFDEIDSQRMLMQALKSDESLTKRIGTTTTTDNQWHLHEIALEVFDKISTGDTQYYCLCSNNNTVPPFKQSHQEPNEKEHLNKCFPRVIRKKYRTVHLARGNKKKHKRH